MFRDARTELGSVFRCAFKDEFHRVIIEMLTIDEFEQAWKSLLEKYKLQSHHYMVRSYDKRKRWSKCYIRGKFCARMTSTQRSEKRHSYVENCRTTK